MKAPSRSLLGSSHAGFESMLYDIFPRLSFYDCKVKSRYIFRLLISAICLASKHATSVDASVNVRRQWRAHVQVGKRHEVSLRAGAEVQQHLGDIGQHRILYVSRDSA